MNRRDRVEQDTLTGLFGSLAVGGHERPEFPVAAEHRIGGSRCFALRWALSDLWDAPRRGEVP